MIITKETAVKIAHCHQEIENAQNLINEMAVILKNDREKSTPKMYNAFGEKIGLMLGVPSGDNGHQLFGVNSDLAIKIIEKHIEEKKARLIELMAIAKIELLSEEKATSVEIS